MTRDLLSSDGDVALVVDDVSSEGFDEVFLMRGLQSSKVIRDWLVRDLLSTDGDVVLSADDVSFSGFWDGSLSRGTPTFHGVWDMVLTADDVSPDGLRSDPLMGVVQSPNGDMDDVLMRDLLPSRCVVLTVDNMPSNFGHVLGRDMLSSDLFRKDVLSSDVGWIKVFFRDLLSSDWCWEVVLVSHRSGDINQVVLSLFFALIWSLRASWDLVSYLDWFTCGSRTGLHDDPSGRQGRLPVGVSRRGEAHRRRRVVGFGRPGLRAVSARTSAGDVSSVLLPEDHVGHPVDLRHSRHGVDELLEELSVPDVVRMFPQERPEVEQQLGVFHRTAAALQENQNRVLSEVCGHAGFLRG